MVLQRDTLSIGIVIGRRETGFPGRDLNGESGRSSEGVSLDVINRKDVGAEIILPFQILIGRIAPAVDGF